MKCNRCHTCGTTIKIVCDGEEYCSSCEQYQRPINHGWSRSYNDHTPCWQSPMLFDPMPDYDLIIDGWRGEDKESPLYGTIPDLTHPYLVVVDATNNLVDMYKESLLEIDYPILKVYKIDSYSAYYSKNSLFTDKQKIRNKWIPRGYKLECYSLEYGEGYFAYIVVSKES